MRFAAYRDRDATGLAVSENGKDYVGLSADDPNFPGDLLSLLRKGGDALSQARRVVLTGKPVDLAMVGLLPPIPNPPKIICVGLNYADHSTESGFKVPDYPALFARFSSSLIAHGDLLVRPRVSTQFDYEGELVAIVGKGGRHVSKSNALDHIAGYSIFNDGSIRDYQFKSTQWDIGKNFDGTGAFGPAFVTADELPPGCKGLLLETRLNGQTVQSASIDDMLFDVQSLVAIISEAITLEPGDVIVTGTPAGVGFARKPQLFMKPGDVCEVIIEKLGTLRNGIADEVAVI